MFAGNNQTAMKFKAHIDIMPHKELLDPQGKTIAKHMKDIDVLGVDDVRIGKHIEILLEAIDIKEATQKIEMACKKLLSNVIMENYTYHLEEQGIGTE